jgi:predicted nucleic acid-binding protein
MPTLFLTDTNVILRRARFNDPLCAPARDAISALISQGDLLHIATQNIIECWSALTRPVANNGFGMNPAQADVEARQLEEFFVLLPDTPTIYPHWRRLVVSHAVSGVRVHDARLVAVMLAHGVSHLLTFNVADFRRYSEITVVDPRSL